MAFPHPSGRMVRGEDGADGIALGDRGDEGEGAGGPARRRRPLSAGGAAAEAVPGRTAHRLPQLATERARKRDPVRGQAEIGLVAGAVLDRHKMAKHFEVGIGEARLTWRREPDCIGHEARLRWVYVVRTSLPVEAMRAGEAVQAYKDLARVERAFRRLKTVDLDIRPVRHWTAERVRAYVFLCISPTMSSGTCGKPTGRGQRNRPRQR